MSSVNGDPLMAETKIKLFQKSLDQNQKKKKTYKDQNQNFLYL